MHRVTKQIALAKQLRAWRDRWGQLTQVQAAAALGITVRTLENWEQARHTPRGLALEALQTKLQSPPES